MFNIFGESKISNLIFFPFILAGLWIFYFGNPIPTDTENAFPLFFELLKYTDYLNKWVVLIPFTVILITAYNLNQVAHRYDLLENANDYTGVFYIITTCFFLDQVSLNPIIFANLFISIALNRIFKIGFTINPNFLVFDVGLMVGIAGMFYYPAYYLIIASIIGLSIQQRLTIKFLGIIVLGLLLPFCLWLAYEYLIGIFSINEVYEAIKPFKKLKIIKPPSIRAYSFISLIIIILIFAIVNFFKTLSQPIKIRENHAIKTFFAWLIVSVLAFLLIDKSSLVVISFLAIPISTVLTHYISSIERPFIVELIFFSFIGFIVLNQWL